MVLSNEGEPVAGPATLINSYSLGRNFLYDGF
jgi:hypothetical protein